MFHSQPLQILLCGKLSTPQSVACLLPGFQQCGVRHRSVFSWFVLCLKREWDLPLSCRLIFRAQPGNRSAQILLAKGLSPSTEGWIGTVTSQVISKAVGHLLSICYGLSYARHGRCKDAKRETVLTLEFHSFIYSTKPILGTGDKTVNKTETVPALAEVTLQQGQENNRTAALGRKRKQVTTETVRVYRF